MTAVLLDGMRLLWFHPPNGAYLGGSSRGRAGAQMKSQGLKPGVPDIVILTPAPTNGKPCFIELKTKTGRLTAAQDKWRLALIDLGYNWALCRGIDDVISILDEWGYQVIPRKRLALRPHPMQLTLN
jgi:hypothetical protein